MKTDMTYKFMLCIGCIHETTKFYGKCIHCSRNPYSTQDYYELPKIKDRIGD